MLSTCKIHNYVKNVKKDILLVKVVMFHSGCWVKDGQGRVDLESECEKKVCDPCELICLFFGELRSLNCLIFGDFCDLVCLFFGSCTHLSEIICLYFQRCISATKIIFNKNNTELLSKITIWTIGELNLKLFQLHLGLVWVVCSPVIQIVAETSNKETKDFKFVHEPSISLQKRNYS